MSKYSHRPSSWFEEIVDKLGGEDNADRFLRDEFTVTEPIHLRGERDGMIYFSVTSDGTTGPDWIAWQAREGVRVSDPAKRVLRSPDFKPTKGVTTEIAILKGSLFEYGDQFMDQVRAEGHRHNLRNPNAEVACLIRKKFIRHKEIFAVSPVGIAIMHEPIYMATYDGRVPHLLTISDDSDHCRFHASEVKLCTSDFGYAFAVPQVSSGH